MTMTMTKRNRSYTALLRSIWRSIRRKFSAQLAFSTSPYLATLHLASLPIHMADGTSKGWRPRSTIQIGVGWQAVLNNLRGVVGCASEARNCLCDISPLLLPPVLVQSFRLQSQRKKIQNTYFRIRNTKLLNLWNICTWDFCFSLYLSAKNNS